MKVNAVGDAVKCLVHVQRLLPGAEMDFDVPALAVKPNQFVGGALLHRNIGHEDGHRKYPYLLRDLIIARPDHVPHGVVLE